MSGASAQRVLKAPLSLALCVRPCVFVLEAGDVHRVRRAPEVLEAGKIASLQSQLWRNGCFPLFKSKSAVPRLGQGNELAMAWRSMCVSCVCECACVCVHVHAG